MIKNILIIAVVLALTSCNQTTKQEAKNGEVSTSVIDKKDNLLIGSWVEPNPINNKEVQGIKINQDGTAESINMATLVYKKWWEEPNKLVVVSESIGNGMTIIDTTNYEIVKLNNNELELKDGDFTVKYKKQ